MVGLTTILSASAALLMAAQSVSTAPTHEKARSLLPRQTHAESPQCKALCDPGDAILAAPPPNACTDANADTLSACFSCAVTAGDERKYYEDFANGFIDVCKNTGLPIKSINIAGGNAASGTPGDQKKGAARRVSTSAAAVVFCLITVSLVL